MRGYVVSAQGLCFDGSGRKEITGIFQSYIIKYVIIDEKKKDNRQGLYC